MGSKLFMENIYCIEITGARAHGGFIQETDHTNHAQVTHVCEYTIVAYLIAPSCHNLISFPQFRIIRKRSIIYYNSLLFSFHCHGCHSSITHVLSSSVDPLRPVLIFTLIVSVDAVTTEWCDKQGWKKAAHK